MTAAGATASDTAHQLPAKPPSRTANEGDSAEEVEKVDILVAGSLAVDLACDYVPRAAERMMNVTPSLHTSNPAIIEQSLGGVGYNVAIAAKHVGSSVLFCSLVGDDLTGRAALASLHGEGLHAEGVQILPSSAAARTAQYVATNDANKDLFVAMADMSIMELPERDLDFEGTWEPMVRRTKPRWVVVDGNWSPGVLKKWVDLGKQYESRVAFEPVSLSKSRGVFAAIGPSDTVPNNKVSLAAPNKLELVAMHEQAHIQGLFESAEWWDVINSMGISSSNSRERLVAITSATLVDEGTPQQSIQLLPFMPCVITKLGSQGVLLTQLLRSGDPRLSSAEHAPYILSVLSGASGERGIIGGVYMRLFPPAKVLTPESITSVNAAGDTLVGVLVAGLARTSEQGRATMGIEELIEIAQDASVETLKSSGGVSGNISRLREVLRGKQIT